MHSRKRAGSVPKRYAGWLYLAGVVCGAAAYVRRFTSGQSLAVELQGGADWTDRYIDK